MTIIIMIMIIIIIIIIIIGKTALLEPQPSLEDSARFDPVHTSLNFATVIFSRARPSALRQPPNLVGPVSEFMFPQ
jgi:hypothetical protein